MLGFGKGIEQYKVPIFWVDDREWDKGKMWISDLPEAAFPREFEGEDWYFVERQNGGETYNYRIFPYVDPLSDKEVPPWKLFSSTTFDLLKKRLSRREPRSEPLALALLIVMIVAGFCFLFLLVAVLMGGD